MNNKMPRGDKIRVCKYFVAIKKDALSKEWLNKSEIGVVEQDCNTAKIFKRYGTLWRELNDLSVLDKREFENFNE